MLEYCVFGTSHWRADDVGATIFSCPHQRKRTLLALPDRPRLLPLRRRWRVGNHRIARGSVVDEVSLADELVNKKIAGAGLDIFDKEPSAAEALFTLDNVVLLPHVASGTRETRQAMADLTLANLRNYVNGGELLTPVG